MVIKCGNCGELMESDVELADGTPIRCPFCGKKAVYRKSESNNPKLRVISETAKQACHSGHPSSPVPPVVHPSRQRVKPQAANGGGKCFGCRTHPSRCRRTVVLLVEI